MVQHNDKCDLKSTLNWIVVEGWLCKRKLGHIGVLINTFAPESEVDAPKPKEVERTLKSAAIS